MFKTKYRAMVRDGDPCTRCLNPIKSLKLHSYNSRNRGIHKDCMAHQIEALRQERGAMKRKARDRRGRGPIVDGDPCKYCYQPIMNIALDTVRGHPGSHKWCYQVNREAKRQVALQDATPAEQKLSWWTTMRYAAEYRSKRAGYTDFELRRETPLAMPDYCPILGLKLDYSRVGKRSPNSASIDQIKPGGGYTYANACVVSWRANSVKTDATVSEMERVLYWLLKQGVK